LVVAEPELEGVSELETEEDPEPAEGSFELSPPEQPARVRTATSAGASRAVAA